MTSQVALLASVASSAGTANVAVPVNSARSLAFKVAANWGAASSSGLATVITVSQDNGSTYIASNQSFPVIKAAATGEVEGNIIYHLRDNPYALDAGPITHVKLTVTNNDGSNAASVAILYEDLKIASAQ